MKTEEKAQHTKKVFEVESDLPIDEYIISEALNRYVGHFRATVKEIPIAKAANR